MSTEVLILPGQSKIAGTYHFLSSKNKTIGVIESCFWWLKWIQHHQRPIGHPKYWSLIAVTRISKNFCWILSKSCQNFYYFPGKNDASLDYDHNNMEKISTLYPKLSRWEWLLWMKISHLNFFKCHMHMIYKGLKWMRARMVLSVYGLTCTNDMDNMFVFGPYNSAMC